MAKVLFLSGLGDEQPEIRGAKALNRLWQLFGLELYFVHIGWADSESYNSKLERIINKVDELSKNEPIALVGVSAGASAAVNAYAKRSGKVSTLIFICGKYTRTKGVNPMFYKKNPAFKVSLYRSEEVATKFTQTDKTKVLSLRPIRDYLVPPRPNDISGIKVKRVAAVGHIAGCWVSLIFYVRTIAKFISS